ncbi:MAG: nucleotidyltransferase family protein [Alphaproteobacteria bacterium]|nr:nucleotidyltransferase family protein [Alphaproteobacteria bacterium]
MLKLETAMILAAGRGSRMRELTNELPKPLIKVQGKTLIDHIVDKLITVGIKRCIVNLCYLGDMIKEQLLKRSNEMEFVFSYEDEALETGGGLKKALPLFKDQEELLVVNADPLWTEVRIPALAKLMSSYDLFPNIADVMLMVLPLDKNRIHGFDGVGDYFMETEGKLRRRLKEETSAPFIYGGAQIIRKSFFESATEQMPENSKFSLNVAYDAAQKQGRLVGVSHDGEWFHVGTPEAVVDAESNFHDTIISPEICRKITELSEKDFREISTNS